ncbi:MAG: Gfo/Idh/MocA family oxidoreductase [Clostridiales bacterium]|nr:Gfo/Idh/MocA family oxidoreductase [Clostridiales bacterium]
MYRIGIIGTENSHAMAFSKYLNLPDPTTGAFAVPDARVTMVMGPDAESARGVMQEARVPVCAADPADFLGQVDAMMITSRRGSVHARYAMPFIEAGIPLFVDKPFTSDPGEAAELIAAVKRRGTPIMGGSSLKFAADTLALRDTARELAAKEELLSASLRYAADPDSEYDGFYFYASHLVEIALAVFGSDAKAVMASVVRGNVTALVEFPCCGVSLHFMHSSYICEGSLYSKKDTLTKTISLANIYEQEVNHFIRMLRTGEPPQPPEALVLPVRIIDAILESIKTGQRIAL